MTTIAVNTPPKVSAPRGAKIAAIWFSALLNWFETKAEHRAERHEQANRQAEAARVRLFAQDMLGQAVDLIPTMADPKDLFAQLTLATPAAALRLRAA